MEPVDSGNEIGVKQEPRSAHGRAVNKSRAEQEPRSAHGRAVKKRLLWLKKQWQDRLVGLVVKGYALQLGTPEEDSRNCQIAHDRRNR